MSFNSAGFLLFFPVVTAVYFSIPQKFRWAWLLFASYVFYVSWNPWCAIFLAAVTLITYCCGRLIGREGASPESTRRKKRWVALGCVLSLGILFTFKYLDFFGGLYDGLLGLFGPAPAQTTFGLLLPIGISFYTFQSLTYLVDVYRGQVAPQKHLGKYALFVAFFPQIVSGPIGKAREMLPQFDEVHVFGYDRARNGILLMLWGYFEKVVVADRLGQLVGTVFADPAKYYGMSAIVAAVFFAFQLYCDFAGYSNIALGVGQILGFRLPVNFNRPYFSKSIPEFWRRWHISLGSWFRDYLYIPLGGSRCSKARHLLNILIVFAVTGLWHGAAVTFVVWGLLHGIYQVVGILTRPAKQRAMQRLHLRESSFGVKLCRVAATFVLTDFAWIFFRANTFADACTLIGNMFRFDPAAFSDGSLFTLGLSAPDFWVALAGIAVVLVVDLLGRRRILREVVLSRGPKTRWAIYLVTALIVLFFGIYGPQYSAQQFIYNKF